MVSDGVVVVVKAVEMAAVVDVVLVLVVLLSLTVVRLIVMAVAEHRLRWRWLGRLQQRRW